MTPKKYKQDLRVFEENIDNCELNLKHCSDEKQERVMKIYLKSIKMIKTNL